MSESGVAAGRGDTGRVELATDRAHPARMYDFLTGGKTHYPADRAAARKVMAAAPGTVTAMTANRRFLHRVVRHLAVDCGIDQFLDIGTGIPTSPNVHEIAQRARPAARVVYVDNDPIVLAHARALMSSSPEGATAYLHGDARDPRAILDAPELRETLDLTRPVAVVMMALLHFVVDDAEAAGIVATLRDAVPSGSYLVITHGTSDFNRADSTAGADAYRGAGIEARLRGRAEVRELARGFELLPPAVDLVSKWWPTPEDDYVPDADAFFYALVGRKP